MRDVVKKIANDIRDMVVKPKYEWYCGDCNEKFSQRYLYAHHWFAKRTCPNCSSFDSLKRWSLNKFSTNPTRTYTISTA